MEITLFCLTVLLDFYVLDLPVRKINKEVFERSMPTKGHRIFMRITQIGIMFFVVIAHILLTLKIIGIIPWW